MNKGQFKKGDKRSIAAARKGGVATAKKRQDNFLIIDEQAAVPKIELHKPKWWQGWFK